MPIKFRCEHCGKSIQAPDTAGGKRGKCPYCKQGNYIPAPVSEADLLDVSEDTELEQARQRERQALLDQERQLLAEVGSAATVPFDQRDDLTPEDLYPFVISYCLAIFNGSLEQSQEQVDKLKKHQSMGQSAVEDFLAEKTSDDSLTCIPAPVLKGLLRDLKGKLAVGGPAGKGKGKAKA
ncbi:MAG: hypothetical protein ABFD92_10040 [Planctomycetaceae bacterium]|nr:RNHCP domain-containing protein [Planctomycetaceae bacterium]